MESSFQVANLNKSEATMLCAGQLTITGGDTLWEPSLLDNLLKELLRIFMRTTIVQDLPNSEHTSILSMVGNVYVAEVCDEVKLRLPLRVAPSI